MPFNTPRTQQWNIGYQRQIYRRGSIDVGYVGSHGDHLIQPVDINQPQPADVVARRRRRHQSPRGPYRGVHAGINMRQTTAYSNYKGLLTQFRHEGGRAGTYTLNYTLSRNRTTATNDRDAADFPQNPQDLEPNTPTRAPIAGTSSTRPTSIELPFFSETPTRC